jgi:hypothetical protein
LFLEPLGEDFWLRPGERFIVVGDEFDAQFEIDSMPGHVIVNVMAGDARNVQIIDAASGGASANMPAPPPGPTARASSSTAERMRLRPQVVQSAARITSVAPRAW